MNTQLDSKSVRYAIIDTETSGLFDFTKPADAEGQPRLASLGIILLDENLAETLAVEMFVKPDGWEMAPELELINGLTTAKLNEVGIPVADVLKVYTEIVDGGYVVVAFNAQFDLKMMRGELRRAGIDDRFERTPNLCVMRASVDVCRVPKKTGRGFKFPKLSEACKHFGIVQENEHSALGDARAALGVFRQLHGMNALPVAEVHYAKTEPEAAPATAPAIVDIEAAPVPLPTIGGNNPPGPIQYAAETMDALSDWMKDHPVIQTEDEAREAKLLIDRAKISLGEMEDERDAKVRPLNEQVSQINRKYKELHNIDKKKPGTFDKIFAELELRVEAFMLAEEAKRIEAANEARRKLEEAEQLAREAEAKEQEALQNAAVGELGVDVAEVTKQADVAYAGFERQSRFAARAERDTTVRIGGGFKSALTLRTTEVLSIKSVDAAILILRAVGVTPKIEEAMLTSSRDYKKMSGKLPDGVTVTEERGL